MDTLYAENLPSSFGNDKIGVKVITLININNIKTLDRDLKFQNN